MCRLGCADSSISVNRLSGGGGVWDTLGGGASLGVRPKRVRESCYAMTPWPPPRLRTVLLLTVGTVVVVSACKEGDICSEYSATICRNSSCVSACSLRGMQECQCDVEEDNYCYLCCGNSHHQCLPAHHHSILRPNGERWEREACGRCRQHGAELEGLPCDDTDPARLCINGKCSNSVCHTKTAGSFCDRKMEKLCVDNTCENPCARFAPHLMVCECPAIDQDTGFASEDRCQLCCYDFNLKPANRRCQNAYRKYKITDQFQKPIFRVGIECAGGKTCNKYGVCGASALAAAFFVPLLLLRGLW